MPTRRVIRQSGDLFDTRGPRRLSGRDIRENSSNINFDTSWNRYERGDGPLSPKNWPRFSTRESWFRTPRGRNDDVMTFDESYTSRRATFPSPILCFPPRVVVRTCTRAGGS